jgi:DNA-binding LacI/PurR family transcriptional regulator
MGKKTARTLEDIARLANVSKSTVSRALNNSPLISQETRAHVQAIAREQNFCLNVTARNLSLRQSHTVAFVAEVFSAEDLFGLELLSGIGNALHALNYELLIIHVNSRDNAWARTYLDSGRVDGFILLTPNHKASRIRALSEMAVPFIVWGLPGPRFNYSTVMGDNVAGGMAATQHLIDRGRQRIAFLGGPHDDPEVHHRFQGYASTLQAAGLSPDPNRLAYGDWYFESGLVAMRRLLQQAPDLDAVFACSDFMALAAIQVIQESGKRVPEDVAVIGYDDLSVALYNNLPLTTIRQDIALAGKLLAQNLIQYIQTGVVTNVTLPVELVVRKST